MRLHVKPVLNWANVCSPNILQTVRRTTIRFLIEFLLRRTLVQTVRRTTLRSKLAYNEMQSSAPTCAGIEKRSRQHDPQCRLKSSHVKSIYFNYLSQGNSTNYYIILDPRDKAALPTSKKIGQFPPKRVKY